MQLITPLGCWLPAYNTDYTWQWHSCPKSFFLFHHLNGQWWAFSPVRQYNIHIGYSHNLSPTFFPTDTVPATPVLFPWKIHMPLPLSPILPSPQHSFPLYPLATRLVTLPEEWIQPLWHEIHPHAHSTTLHNVLLSNTQIHLVSDAAVHPNGTGTRAWIIWAYSKLWSREGYVPSAVANIYSGLAEAYGLYTVLHFFQHYMMLLYPLILPHPHTIHIHCNNSGVIDQILSTSFLLPPLQWYSRQLPNLCRAMGSAASYAPHPGNVPSCQGPPKGNCWPTPNSTWEIKHWLWQASFLHATHLHWLPHLCYPISTSRIPTPMHLPPMHYPMPKAHSAWCSHQLLLLWLPLGKVWVACISRAYNTLANNLIGIEAV